MDLQKDNTWFASQFFLTWLNWQLFVLLGFYLLFFSVCIPWPVDCASLNATQDIIKPLCHKSTLLVHAQVGVHQETSVLLCNATFEPVGPQNILDLGFVTPPGVGLAASPWWNSSSSCVPVFSSCEHPCRWQLAKDTVPHHADYEWRCWTGVDPV